MSLIETYRKNINRKRIELQKLSSAKSKESRKKPALNRKIIGAKNASSRTKSETIVKSKLNQIKTAENSLAKIDKKTADIDRKIANKTKELSNEEKKLNDQLKKMDKKKADEEKKRLKDSEKLNRTLSKQQQKQAKMQETLVDLQSIPEEITVLFMASNPDVDDMYLKLDEEARSIQKMIRKTEYRDSVKFETRWAARPLDILEAINELNPSVIHFSGHGTETDELVLQNIDGSPKFVTKEAIVQTMMTSSDQIRLIFFNTCFSYGQAEAVVEHVEAAIGMNNPISDNAARIFSAQFYSALGFGKSVETAFEQAKSALMLEGILEEDTPELYTKDGIEPENIIIVKPK